jgi:hypothetical protein
MPESLSTTFNFSYLLLLKLDCIAAMATIKGTYYYRGKRAYKYEVTVYDTEDYKTLFYYIKISNPEGKTAITDWNFRARGIKETIRIYIEEMVEKRNIQHS